jgi:lipoate-protein ligase A
MRLARRGVANFPQRLADPARKVQSYISASSDPYLNLSIEDYILRTSPPDSVVLFLYTNRPSIIIGRNQNPWSEVALHMLKAPELTKSEETTMQPLASFKKHNEQLDNNRWAPLASIGRDVDLVRRRSGGGTVFHDEGNMNWSITMPMSDFTRDKNAEMVVRALRKMGVDRARVNERHDIVLDQGQKDKRRKKVDPGDTHLTDYMITPDSLPKPIVHAPPPPLKVSGSAYKLTRGRALHHATTLLSSPNIHLISNYLKSPAASWIQAKGVESVSSPVANIGLEVAVFQKCLQEEFAATYGKDPIVETVGDEHLQISEIRKGYDELQVCSLHEVPRNVSDYHRPKTGCGLRHHSSPSYFAPCLKSKSK